MKKAYVFSGQGGQSVGMGRDLFEKSSVARAVFDEVDAALNEKLSDLIFNGSAEDLNLTMNAQPAIFAVSMAMWKAAGEPETDFVAGHSLGEYSALCAAGAIGITDCVKLLRLRGKLMQSAATGIMAAVIGDVDVKTVCSEAGGVCEVANDNCPGQVVISGETEAVQKAMEIVKTKGAKIVKQLAVSAPLHCSLMAPIVEEMRVDMEKVLWKNPIVPVISNKTADVMTDIDEIKEALLYQLTHGVRWRESVQNMVGLGIGEIVEVGPGNVLTGLNKRIVPELNSYKLEI